MATTKATQLAHTVAHASYAPLASPTFTGTVNLSSGATLGSNATLPSKATDYTHFYPAYKNATAMESYDRWVTSNNSENAYVFLSGVAPTGITSVVDMYWWFIAENGGTQSYQATVAWGISTHDEVINLHGLANTSFFSGLSVVQNDVSRVSLMAVGSSGSRFEDLIADNDAFGMRIMHNTNIAVRPLGASITWRL